MNKIKQVSVALATAGMLASGVAQAAVTNGGFEDNGGAGSFLYGWSRDSSNAGAGPISLYGPCCGISNSPPTYPYGANAAFFGWANLPGASIWQDVATTMGTRYSLSFLYGALAYSNLQTMHVTVLDGLTLLAETNVQAHGTYDLASMMSAHALDFTATSASTRIRFSDTSIHTNNTDGVLDNVSITAVPEPGIYAMMLAGLGLLGLTARRRRQKLKA